jgi:hypothetical protein
MLPAFDGKPQGFVRMTTSAGGTWINADHQ